MRFTSLRHFHLATVNQVLTRLRSDVPLVWRSVKTVGNETFLKKMTSINNWYTKFLGLDEVKLYQDRVVSLQERLLEAQERRRETGRNLAAIRKKSNQLQDEIHKVRRQEDLERFFTLMKEETVVLREENEVVRLFQECDQAERELFTAFTNAVRDSHEKQRAQLEYTKYFGIILSIVGSFLAFCYTTLRKDDLKRFIEESVVQNTPQEPSSEASSDILNLVKSETSRLTELINFKQNEVALMLEREHEAKTKQILYFAATGAVVLVIFKLVSS